MDAWLEILKRDVIYRELVALVEQSARATHIAVAEFDERLRTRASWRKWPRRGHNETS